MEHHQFTVILVLFIFFSPVVLLKDFKCEKCTRRTFANVTSNECFCERSQFCENVSGQCKNCSECFYINDQLLQKLIGVFQNEIQNIIHKYEIDLNALEKLLTDIDINKNVEISALQNLISISRNKTKLVKDISENLQKKIKTLNQDVNSFSDSIPDKTLKKIYEIIKKSNELFEQIKEIDFDTELIKRLFDSKNMLQLISTQTNKMIANISKISEASLHLVLNVEYDINLIESIISKYNVFNVKNPLTNNIEMNIKDLLDIIIHVFTEYADLIKVNNDVIKLKDDSVKTWNTSIQNNKTLSNILVEFDRYSHNLQNENKYLKKIINTSNQFDEINNELHIFLKDIKQYSNDLKEVENFYNNYIKQKNKITLSVHELDKLLNDAQNAYNAYLTNKQNFDLDFDEEINILWRKVEEYEDTLPNCTDT